MGEKSFSGGEGRSNGQLKKSGGMVAPAKGILKSSQNTDQPQQLHALDSSFLASGDIQLPDRILSKSDLQEGNNTTSRIHTLALQEKISRRVSFAPDVTLHSFDFVPETKANLREPRRRAYDVFATSTQNEQVPGEVEDESLPMDLTSPVAVSKQAYKPVFDQEVSMEITQLFPKHDKTHPTDTEETMEFTALQNRSNNAIPEQSTMEITEVHSFKQSAGASRPETPPTSKRRKLAEPSNDIRDSESSEEQDMELSLMEKLSPIKLNSIEPQVTKPVFEEPESYSLQKFIEITGLSFFIDTDLLDKTKKPVVFKTIQPLQPASFRLNKVLNVLYLDTPVLEMNAFICKELMHRVEQSKKQFDDLDRQINTSSPPPLLLSEYFNASYDMRQSMNQQLHLVKSYSKLKAKKSWFEWRFQHLNGIKAVLEENLTLIRGENAKVELELTKARDIRSKAQALREAIKNEIMLLKELPPEACQEEKRLEEKVRLEQLKQELALYAVDITNHQALAEKSSELKSKLTAKVAQLVSLKNEIKSLDQLHSTKPKKSGFTQYDIKKYSAKLDILGKISGVEFVQFKKSELTLRFAWLDTSQQLTINLSNLNNSSAKTYEIIGSADMAFIFDHCYHRAMKAVSVTSSHQHLSLFLASARQSQALIKEYALLRLSFPVEVRLKNDVKVLEIKDFDLRTNSKRIYDLNLNDFLTAAQDKNGSVRVKTTVIERGHSASSSNSAAFFKKIVKILPWFDMSRVIFSENLTK
ncbi:hypothetical protein HG536_0A01640 [Torulaspora globosa]|uniref:Spc7 kinetochore protein domain-containing protein n=1 Tax=Torulaspora globosa TaxID=48254 RepID=A0A7G3ZA11_9SACH|nr:uncharacterized protein HG536_0A01640 [Torulaspora globosa]QLL30347.1 hypothetical protein HG536_0A01640 [Torulaspora globosa]